MDEKVTAAPTQEEIVNWVESATKEVFQTMLGLDATVGEHFIEEPDKGLSMGVIGIIGLVGDWTGTAVVSCSSPLACRVANTLFMQEYAYVNDEVLDAVAEITNMIIGNLKNNLELKLGTMGLSIPAVVFGRNFATRRSGKESWYVIRFDVDGERLDVQLCLTPNQLAGQNLKGMPRIMSLA
ncbi:MAG: chemotaxis protein CheX [Bryobacter sp.]|jgi:chemotaxis protein CheX|nr:chemotaxis protein CheX [Bryobacter sp. CoA8 C33]